MRPITVRPSICISISMRRSSLIATLMLCPTAQSFLTMLAMVDSVTSDFGIPSARRPPARGSALASSTTTLWMRHLLALHVMMSTRPSCGHNATTCRADACHNFGVHSAVNCSQATDTSCHADLRSRSFVSGFYLASSLLLIAHIVPAATL